MASLKALTDSIYAQIKSEPYGTAMWKRVWDNAIVPWLNPLYNVTQWEAASSRYYCTGGAGCKPYTTDSPACNQTFASMTSLIEKVENRNTEHFLSEALQLFNSTWTSFHGAWVAVSGVIQCYYASGQFQGIYFPKDKEISAFPTYTVTTDVTAECTALFNQNYENRGKPLSEYDGDRLIADMWGGDG